MNLFNGAISITGITFQVFIIFGIIFQGYVIGRINCKGVSMGTSGIFLTALLFGGLFGADIHQTLTFRGDDITSQAFQIIENIGLIMFIGSVGMIAGPGIL